MNINECVGKTVLYQSHLPSEEDDVQHGTVEEFSPSSKYVRIDFRWYAVDRISVLEEMPDPKSADDHVSHQELVQKLTATLDAAKEAAKAPPALEILPPAKTESAPAAEVQTSEPAAPAPPVDNAHVEAGAEQFTGPGTGSEPAPEAAAEPAPETTEKL